MPVHEERRPSSSALPTAASSQCECLRRTAGWSVLPHRLRTPRAVAGLASATSSGACTSNQSPANRKRFEARKTITVRNRAPGRAQRKQIQGSPITARGRSYRMVGEPRRKLQCMMPCLSGPLAPRPIADSLQALVLPGYAVVCGRPHCRTYLEPIIICRAYHGHTELV